MKCLSIPILRAAGWSTEGLEGPAWMDLDRGTPDLAYLDPLLRRRLGPLGRAMLHCAGRVAAGLPDLPSVFGSRHGEPARTMPVLEDLAQGLEASPTQFSMNVHNAIAGLWSIARGDRSASTSLAAGPETFGWCLVEALALHRAHGGPVLCVYGDDRLPEPLAPFEDHGAPLHALALLIGGPAERHLQVSLEASGAGIPDAGSQSLHALRAWASLDPEPWQGPHTRWRWAEVSHAPGA